MPKSELSENKSKFLVDETEPWQLTVSNLREIRDYYKGKYNITIYINGETEVGFDFLTQKKIKITEKINRHQTYPMAAYMVKSKICCKFPFIQPIKLVI